VLDARNNGKSINPLRQKSRIVVFAVNLFLAWFLFFLSTGLVSPLGTSAGLWVLAAAAYWLLVLVTTPFFNPPKDSLATAISVLLLLIPVSLPATSPYFGTLQALSYFTIGLSVLVGLFALIAIFNQGRGTYLSSISYQLSEKLGRGEILFTPIVVISALGFYEGNLEWALMVMGFWVVMVVSRPVELVIQLFHYAKSLLSGEAVVVRAIGSIQRIDDPNIVRVTLFDGQSEWTSGKVFIAHLPNGERRYVLPLFPQVQNEETMGTGLLCAKVTVLPFKTSVGRVYEYVEDGLAAKLLTEVGNESGDGEIAGIVCEGSKIGSIKFQVIHGKQLEKGKIVCATVRGKKVYYQLLDADTKEEHFQQNPLGMHVAYAAQLGFYDPAEGFKKFPWLPEMNQPVFLVSADSTVEPVLKANEFVIGKVPSTGFQVPVVLDDLIEYHTAILGKTGTAKTELAFDIIREALKRNTKVFCVDFTGEYKTRLEDCSPEIIDVDSADQKKLETLLFAIDAKGFKADAEQAEVKKLLGEKIKPEIVAKIEAFLKENKSSLGIFQLAEITNTRTTLRLTELYLSAIMNWAREHRKKRKILIVLEEAHTIVPEAYGTFDSNTKWVVERIGQIALQGRKYGVGLMLISQRTALVSKTVLSQCHTYFTHELIDKTSLEYLNGILSLEYVQAIPTLRFLEVIAYGKGVKSEHPVLLKREFSQAKKDASDALNERDEEVTEPATNEEEIIDIPQS